MNSFLELNGEIIDKIDIKKAFKEAEDKLNVLNFEIPSYVMEFTLGGVLSGKTFSHLTDFEKNEIIKYIVEYY